ncbi:GTP cyclohydrolase [Veronia nyctiphanis]|uniref:GTP cyclohydrolase n=1 Tax=Veronia nyctiphanis TaxID=1278244 RepID=A0A4Q0YUJ0_9GAMM|nr:NADAR family protein [Veronia nyctiphanis]RXJ74453.1 GTP cyclohydrolase [Veronia nyctiphanis]
MSDATIHFYEPDEDYGSLSNFYPATLFIDGVTWPTSEHYYQAQKFNHPPVIEAIRFAESAKKAFKLSRLYGHLMRDDWYDIRQDVMRRAITEKFLQHPELRKQLLETGGQELVEHTAKDPFWGDAGDGSGQNEMGKILMEVRAHFQSQTHQQKLEETG